jgi:large subunit ribosomal protein L29
VKVDEKLQDIRSLEGDELVNRLKQSRRELYELRFKLAVGQLEDSSQILKTRKDIARILTVIRQRELGESVAEAPEERSPTGLSTAAGEAEVAEETGSEAADDVRADEDEGPEGQEDEEAAQEQEQEEEK